MYSGFCEIIFRFLGFGAVADRPRAAASPQTMGNETLDGTMVPPRTIEL